VKRTVIVIEAKRVVEEIKTTVRIWYLTPPVIRIRG
jgi:hypothetical protein